MFVSGDLNDKAYVWKLVKQDVVAPIANNADGEEEKKESEEVKTADVAKEEKKGEGEVATTANANE